MPFNQGDQPFGIYDARVASYTSGVYGALSDIMSVEMSRATMQMISDIARGDDKITDAAAIIEGAELALRFTGLNLTAMAIMTGKTKTTISSVEQLQFVGGEAMPYFGAIIKANSNGGTDTWLFLPKIITMANFTFFQGEYGGFTHPEMTLQCLPDETYGVANVITHPTAIEITVIPPANIAEVA